MDLNPLEIDWSLDEYDNVEDIDEVQEEEGDVSISDYIDQPGKEKIDRGVEVDGRRSCCCLWSSNATSLYCAEDINRKQTA